MSYITRNKEAWEEAFEHRLPHWGEDNDRQLREKQLPFFCPDVVAELNKIDFRGKSVAQFCCNNGRELLSLMQLGAKDGVGFDIAENIIRQASETAAKAGIDNCRFVACDVLEIPQAYRRAFDFVLFTIGAITWFEELGTLFQKASDCLRPGGQLLLHDFHPFMNMLPLPGEPCFEPERTDKIAYSYFRTQPWMENDGMGYLSGLYPSKTFTSFSHTMSAVVNSLCAVGLKVTRLHEYDYDVGLCDVYNHKGYPLSYILMAEKE